MAAVEVELGTHGTGVATVTLNEPKRRNAMSSDIVAGLVAAFDRLEPDEQVGAVVVTGAPPAFCAGGSLSDLANLRSEQDALVIYEGFLRIARSSLPTVAAVNGPAVGAGFNLALSCDLRVASTAARFDTRFLDIGLHPGGGSTWLLRQAVGSQVTAALVLFGQVLDGAEAERCGLAWRCVEPDELLAEAGRMAERAASFPRSLTRRAKETLATMAGIPTHADAVAVEVEAQLWSAGQPEFKERLARLQAQISGRGGGDS